MPEREDEKSWTARRPLQAIVRRGGMGIPRRPLVVQERPAFVIAPTIPNLQVPRRVSFQTESEALYQVDGRRWQLTGGVETVPENMLQQVGAAGGVSLQALAWDKAPYDRLYTARQDGRLAVVLPID